MRVLGNGMATDARLCLGASSAASKVRQDSNMRLLVGVDTAIMSTRVRFADWIQMRWRTHIQACPHHMHGCAMGN